MSAVNLLRPTMRHTTAGARILVIGSQGDTAILRDFAAIDAKAGEEPIAPYL